MPELRIDGPGKPLISVSKDGAIGYSWIFGDVRVDVLVADSTLQATTSERGTVRSLQPSEVGRWLSSIAA